MVYFLLLGNFLILDLYINIYDLNYLKKDLSIEELFFFSGIEMKILAPDLLHVIYYHSKNILKMFYEGTRAALPALQLYSMQHALLIGLEFLI